MMKKYLFVFLYLLFSFGLFAQQTQTIPLSAQESKLQLKSSLPDQLVLKNQVKELNAISSIENGNSYTSFEVNGFSRSSEVGKPNLPTLSKLIEVPYGAEIEVIITGYNEEVIDLNEYGLGKIVPSQPSYSKSTDPSDMIFTIDEDYYQTDAMIETPLVKAEVYGVMRGTRLGGIHICPFRYNPVQNVLTVYNDLTFEIRFINADHATTASEKNRLYSPEFEFSQETVINYQVPAVKDAFSNYNAPLKYVIVANTAFETTLDPFVQWKTKQGYNVIEHYVSTGTTAATIKTYLQGLYNAGTSSDPAPLYVLIIGDHSGTYSIPAYASQNTGSGGTDHITDLYYSTLSGSDNLPDIYYGRISAESTNELSNALNKILPYEQYTIPSGTYLNDAIMIAGVDASMAHTFGDAQILYGITNYYNLTHGYSNIFAYFYDNATHPYNVMASNNSGAAASILSKIQAGVGFANYTAHCSADGWSDPVLSRANIASFNNTNEYPFMIGNCCQSFMFDQSDAFGEMLLYTANEGAVGYIGTSQYSYWYEDAWWGMGNTTLTLNATNWNLHTYANTGLGVYDGVWHENGEAYSNWYYTASQMVQKGNLAVQASTSGYKQYYWEIYHCVGDPSLMPYNTEPTALSLTFTTPNVGATSLTVTTEPYTYVAISKNNVLLDAEWSGSGTTVTLTVPAFTTETYCVVGTKQERSPYINQSVVPVNSTTPPVANFVADQTTVLVGTTVNFTDLSTNGPSSWAWTFAGGTPGTSTTQNPSITYNTAGTYTVTLVATNPAGSDTETKTGYIIVNAITSPPVTNFVADQTTISVGGSVNFTDLSTNAPTSWAWTFAGGTPGTSTVQNPTGIVYNTAGVYNVTLVATNGIGSDTETKTGYIIVNECQDVTLSLTPDNYGSETTWTLADDGGTTIATGGPYTDGNTTTITQTWCLDIGCYVFTINDAYGDGICCSYGTGAYSLTNDLTSEVYVSGGTFTTSEVTNFCVVSSSAPPTAAFSSDVTSTCTGLVNFTDESSGVVDSWLWNFGDGATSTDENPSHTYTTEGTFTVTLTATNTYGSDTETMTNLITVDMPAQPVATSGYRCGTGIVNLSATGAGTLEWYNAATGGTLVGTGSTFATPSITSTTTYYVQDVTSAATYNVGNTQSNSNGGNLNSNRYLIFTASVDLTIASVEINPSTTGPRIIELRNSAGTVLQSATVDVTTATIQRVDLNFNVPAGTDYRLGINGTANMWRNNAGVTYPYTEPGVISITGSDAGATYYYYYYDWEILVGESCVSPRTPVTASIYTGPTLAMTSTNETVAGANNGTATATPTGSAPYTYLWNDPAPVQTTQTASGLAAGTYCCTVTDSHSCTSSACATVLVGTTPLAASISSSTNVLCNGVCTGTATAAGAGGIAPYTYNWGSGITTQTATGLCAGTYVVTITDAAASTASASVSITQPASAVNGTTTPTAVACYGGATGQAVAAGSGGTSPYTYNWSNGATTATVTGLVAATYTVTITDVNGCSITRTAVISQPASAVSGTTTATPVACFGLSTGQVSVSSSGGTSPYTYLWTGGSTSATVTGLAAGTYTVTITDSHGCSVTRTATITQPASGVSGTATSTAVSCNGGNNGQVSISGSGGTSPYTYLWTGGSTSSTVTGLVAGTYTVTITDNSGCSTTSSATVSQPAVLANTTSGTNATCGNANGSATATATGGTSPYTYLWTGGATSSTATGLVAGTYSVTITDSHGCTSTGTTTISNIAGPTAAATATNATCGNTDGSATVTPSGGTAPYTYLWSNGGNTATINAIASGSYSYTVTDVNGCQVTGSVAVSDIGAPSANVSFNNAMCYGSSDGNAAVIATGGTAPYSYLWSTGATGTIVTGLAAGTYIVTVTDAVSCQTTQTVVINQPNVIVPITSSTDATCGNSDGTASVSATGGTGAYSYEWSSGATTADVTGLAAGVYTVTVSDANNCEVDETVTINNSGAATVSITFEGVSCYGGNDGTAAAFATGGTSPYSYEWSTGATTNIVTGLSAGTYGLTVTDATGCETINSIVVLEPTALIVDMTSATAEATATATGGVAPYSYEWNTGATTQTITGLADGTYTVTVTDANGCNVTGSVAVIGDGIAQNQNGSFNIYPNPTDGKLNVAISGSNVETMIIIDMLGKQLYKTNVVTDHNVIDMSSYGPGVYFVKFISGERTITRKVVLSR